MCWYSIYTLVSYNYVHVCVFNNYAGTFPLILPVNLPSRYPKTVSCHQHLCESGRSSTRVKQFSGSALNAVELFRGHSKTLLYTDLH